MNSACVRQVVRQMSSGSSKVVVTGMGVICPVGVGTNIAWERLISGHSTGVTTTDPRYDKVASKVVCPVPRGCDEGEWDMDKVFSKGDQQRLSLAMMFGLVAAKEALTDASWSPTTDTEQVRSGVSVGMGMVDLDYIGESYSNLMSGKRKISPYFVPRILPNLAPGHIAIQHKLRGPNHSCSTACATGSHSIGEGFRLIQYGSADVMVCGGVDACINPLAMTGFSRARALSTNFNSTPSTASRPFDLNRDGFVMGEGAGILVLEREEHAIARGAPRIYCEVSGYGTSGDADHITSAREDGAGAAQAMETALADAGLGGTDVWCVNCHATSTPLGDKAECGAVRKVIGSRNVLVTSNKGAMGHLLGAAGAVESVFSVKSLLEGVVPPSINVETLDPELGEGLNIVTNTLFEDKVTDMKKRVVLKNSFGFGGTNVSLVFQPYVR